jgi:hypothetical protein
MSSDSTGEQQPGRFRKGQSGNPAGRPRGSRNSATLAVEALLDGEAEAFTRRVIGMALGGDTIALRLCLDRIYPARRDRPVKFALPPITCARDAADISAAVAVAVSNGDLTLSEAAEFAKLIDSYVKAYQVAELEDRAENNNTLVRLSSRTDAELLRLIEKSQRKEADRLLISRE